MGCASSGGDSGSRGGEPGAAVSGSIASPTANGYLSGGGGATSNGLAAFQGCSYPGGGGSTCTSYPYPSHMQTSYMGNFSAGGSTSTGTGSTYSSQFNPYDSRSLYPTSSAYPAPRAFVPHSAINLSVKPPTSTASTASSAQSPSSQQQQQPGGSLDLSNAGGDTSYLGLSSSAASTGPSQILDLRADRWVVCYQRRN